MSPTRSNATTDRTPGVHQRVRGRARVVLAVVVVVVAVASSACVWAPPPVGAVIDGVAGTGAIGYSGDGGAATAARLFNPHDVAVDGFGRMVIADTSNHVVRRVSLNGKITTIAGTGTSGYTGDGGPATNAQLANPTGVAVDGSGRTYIAARGSHVVRRIETDGTITTIAGTGTEGYSGDGGPATDAMLNRPFKIALDASGRLFIADNWNARVRMVDLDGTITTVAGAGLITTFELAASVDVNDTGTVAYVADPAANKVIVLDLVAGVVMETIGSGHEGYCCDGLDASGAWLSSPLDVAVDPAGNIFIADFGNNRVRWVTATDNTIRTLTGDGNATLTGNDGPPQAATGEYQGLGLDPHTPALLTAGNNTIRRTWGGGTAIYGDVTDPDTAPLAGVTVNLYLGNDLATPVATATTTSEGHYGFTLSGTGPYRLEFVPGPDHQTEWFEDATTGPTATPINLAKGQRIQIDAQLTPT